MQKGDTKSAEKYLTAASNYFTSRTQNEKNNYYGSTCKYYGDLFLAEHQPIKALEYYQKAIIQLNLKFNNKDIYTNPQNFIGDFASYDLFKALLAKAECFKTLYESEHSETYFKGARITYQSAFDLADYIKKSIDNDEARLFIADNVLAGYRKAVDLVMDEYAKTKDKPLVELALQWVSKSRAASLAISLKENSIKQYAGIPDSLLEKERNVKVNISRLKLQLQEATGSISREQTISNINTAELKLHKVLNAYRQYSSYYRQKYLVDTISISDIQKNISDSKTAVVCYFKGEFFLRAFVIKSSSIVAYKLPYNSALDNSITNFVSNLQLAEAGKGYNETNLSKYLYQALITPLQSSIADISSLIIIPDQQLINLPFEALLMPDENYLVEKYAVTYQYALPFLHLFNKANASTKKLAAAPFTSRVKTLGNFSPLLSSAQEISSFSTNEKLINAKATKKSFLLQASSASVIHLATHAFVNYDEPENSFIAFYPVNNNDSSYKIFAHELYNLQLPKAGLVFLSACETGSGKMSQSEGSLSLSRAFAYAGCPNIVTSLWKAEDKSTAYISERFYSYVDKGYSYAKALQQAKKDLRN